MPEVSKRLLLESTKNSIEGFIDLIYSVQDGNKKSSFIPKNSDSIWKNLGSSFDLFLEYN